MERDGEVLSELCELLNTNVFQLGTSVRKLQEAARKGTTDEEGKTIRLASACIDDEEICSQEKDFSIGPMCASRSRKLSGTPVMSAPPVEEAGAFVTYLRSMACVSPGVFKGERSENFREFLRRFRRKYESVISEEDTLLDILVDDHLGGRAKNVFMALPRGVKERGFDAVVEEMSKLLAEDSTAGRLRALNELRNLTMRPNQDVASFCNVLEKLGREANPGCSLEDRSLEYAQILLDNLYGWPEHCQLVAAVHRVEPRKVYDEVKHLALTIEQSRRMIGTHYNKHSGVSWRHRAAVTGAT
ncbi:unnamed protein product [Nippostrongylus brasiliensis]|uniref:Uncharacterized protein n=1 Tax=Nippostrongylus brasiliensis TaxID=27835 RepID=A0A0N4YCY1_NIPBR|nr:unnamed protein product [Nippostrongylus brasiliensis]